MEFSSYIFIFAFLPVVLFIYFGLSKFVSKKVQHSFLVLASFVFYGYTNPYYLPLILLSICVNYAIATGVENKEKTLRKAIFVAGILFNIGFLGYFKYYGFFVSSVNEIFATEYTLKNLILPLGISFFTFQQIVYQIQVWKKEEKLPAFIDYVLFISFFPYVISGPIVFYRDVKDQYKDDKNRYFNSNNFSQGLFIFMIGLFKKTVIANSLAFIVDNGVYYQYADLSFGAAWITTMAWFIQLFFDFSGYSDMAIGLGKMLNINLPVNFYSPFKAESIRDFWKRWHITLSRALTVMIYFPLGGNRKGMVRTCVNIFIVFFISGLWHGESWKFILWGTLHGIVRVLEEVFAKPLEKIPGFIRVTCTFLFAGTLFIFFRAPNVDAALDIMRRMYFPDTISFSGIGSLANDGILSYPNPLQTAYVAGFVLIILAITFISKKNSIDLYNDFRPTKKNAVIAAALFSLSIIHMSRASAFIYFNF